MKDYFSPFLGIGWSNFLLCSSPLSLRIMACDGSENWLYSSDSRERLLPLLSLFEDLPAVVAVSRLNGMVETRQSALGPMLLSLLLSPGGVSCLLASIPSLCSLLRKSDISKLGFSYIVPLYKYWVYTHTDTHIYTNTDPQTKLDVWH